MLCFNAYSLANRVVGWAHLFEFRAASHCNLIGRFPGNDKNVDRAYKKEGPPLAHSALGNRGVLVCAVLVRRGAEPGESVEMAGPATDQGGLLLRRQLMGLASISLNSFLLSFCMHYVSLTYMWPHCVHV